MNMNMNTIIQMMPNNWMILNILNLMFMMSFMIKMNQQMMTKKYTFMKKK